MNPRVTAEVIGVVENQLKSGDPPDTRATLARLRNEGWSDEDAKVLIGRVLASEMTRMLRSGTPFDRQRYAGKLGLLPEEPEE